MKVFIAAIILWITIGQALADQSLSFGPKEAKLNGSIKYSVIGNYNAHFEAYQGKIGFDEDTGKVRSVYLEIDAGSIKSDCGWCDKIVRSKQILAVTQYPRIIFQSSEIIKNDAGYLVSGVLEMHGRRKQMSFPFDVEDGNFKGRWVINRKEFDITWNKILDQGGVLVGNHITVDWQIRIVK